MGAAGAMATLAAYVPLGHGFCFQVVVNRMTAVAERAGRPLEVIGRVKWHPPVRSIFDEIGSLDLVSDVPLSRKGKIVVSYLLEVALFPFAAVNECDVVLFEVNNRIWLR